MTVPEFASIDTLMVAFEAFQRRTRGLRAPTLHGYTMLARRFLCTALGDDPVDVQRLAASDVVGFVTDMTSIRSIRRVATVLDPAGARARSCGA